MYSIRPLDEASFDDAVTLMTNAYPGIARDGGAGLDRVRQYMRDELLDPRVSYCGCYDDRRLVGFMRLHDFLINVRGTMINGGGVGGVAVDLTHKKRGVAKAMMEYYLRQYRFREASIALLWPFRPDFYHQMGFGYGAKMYRYRVTAQQLPPSEERFRCRFLNANDIPQLLGCHNAIAAERHGMAEENEHTFFKTFRPERMHKVLGYEFDGVLEGYAVLAFTNFDPGNFIKYDLRVHHLLYLTPRALSGMLGFLHSQFDQVRHVLVASPDDAFHYLCQDPRDNSDVLEQPVFHQTNTAGVGIMFRVIDFDRLCGQLQPVAFPGAEISVGITLRDTFLPENNGRRVVTFRGGRAELVAVDSPTVEISLPIAEFSSMVMGAVTFDKLCEYGIATIDKPARVADVTHLFATETPPLCLTSF